MKKHLFLLNILIAFLACNQSGGNNQNGKDTSTMVVKDYVPEIEQTSDITMKSDFFIINTEGIAEIKDAVEKVKKLQTEKHPAGYLWIPDYESLSKKEMYSVFIGPFTEIDSCIRYLEYYKKTNPEAYALKVQHNKDRLLINGKYDIRVNDVKQFLILTYSTPEDEEQYSEDGGEDWGWFTNDVATYFNKNNPDKVIFSSVYGSWLSTPDIKELEKELKPEGFGYVLIKGKDKTFLSHNLPDNIITEACKFFNLVKKDYTPGE